MNRMRGDVAAPFGGRERLFRLTFEGLAAIEGAVGTGIVAIASRFPARSVGTTEVTAILQEGLKGAGQPMELQPLEAAIMETGFVDAARLAGRVLAAGLGADGEGRTETPGKL